MQHARRPSTTLCLARPHTTKKKRQLAEGPGLAEFVSGEVSAADAGSYDGELVLKNSSAKRCVTTFVYKLVGMYTCTSI